MTLPLTGQKISFLYRNSIFKQLAIANSRMDAWQASSSEHKSFVPTRKVGGMSKNSSHIT
jgi:hypothetical protein